MHSNTVVKVDNLSHSYGRRAYSSRRAGALNTQVLLALERLNLVLAAGEITALLGPNGAGKTTLIKLLLGLLPIQQGAISVLGSTPGSARARQGVGVMLQASGVQENLTVLELLQLFRSLYQQPLAIAELVQRLELDALVNKRYQSLSRGQQQRVLFAIALCGNPRLLILDEPSTGMDPAVRRNFWQVLRECRQQGRTILLCTHYMDEAEQLADNILLLNQGRVLMYDSPNAIRQEVPSRIISLRTSLNTEQLTAFPDVQLVQSVNGRVHVYCRRAESILRELLALDHTAREIEVRGTDLETAFLALTQDAAHSMEQSA